jgi:hypothetical protein
MVENGVVIIVATDGYCSILSVPVCISAAFTFFVLWEWWGLRKYQGIWNSLTPVPNLTDKILTTDRLLLAVIIQCRTVWINLYRLFNFSAFTYIHGGTRCRSFYSHCSLFSNPDGVIGLFHWLNPSGRTKTLGSTQIPGTLRPALSYRYGLKSKRNT